MIVKLIDNKLQDDGFRVFDTEYENVKYYVKQENSCSNVIRVIDIKDSESMNHEQYLLQKQSIEEHLKQIGNDEIHQITWVLYTDEAKAEELVGDDYMCWLIDRTSYIMSNSGERVEDFYGYKKELSLFLGKSAALIKSGAVNELGSMMYSESEKKQREKIKKKKPVPVTILLVSVNIIFFITYIVIGEPFKESCQMSKPLVLGGEIYRLLSATFMHANFQHLFSNMVLLYVFGEALEPLVGSVKFGIIYFLTGILGNALSLGYELLSGAEYTSVGASGAVYGILGLYIFLALIKFKGISVPMRRLIFVVVFCIYSSLVEENIDFAAHIGGLVTGFLLAVLLCSVGGKRKHEG